MELGKSDIKSRNDWLRDLLEKLAGAKKVDLGTDSSGRPKQLLTEVGDAHFSTITSLAREYITRAHLSVGTGPSPERHGREVSS